MKIDIFIVLFVKENDQNGLDKIQWSQTSLLAKSLVAYFSRQITRRTITAELSITSFFLSQS